MPRIGVTFDDVAQAATKLLSTGESPSVLKVREILGTGSNSTIAEHLKIWRQQKSEQRTVALPEGIPKALLPPLETMWHIANEQADNRFVAYREQTESKIEQLTTERDTWFAQHQQTEKAVAELQQQLQNAEQCIEDYIQQQNDAQAKIQALKADKQSLVSECSNLEQRLTQSQKDHAVQEALLQEQYTRNQAQWQTTLNELKLALDQNHERAEATEARWLRVVDQARDEAKAFKKQHAKALEEKDVVFKNLHKQWQQTEADLFSTHSELAKLQSLSTFQQKHIDSQEAELKRTREELQYLQQQARRTKVNRKRAESAE
jgi:DNA repair exonuclease SbcCD ATPase subunit